MNNGNFKTCARGHFYSATLDHCPYCPSTGSSNSKPSSAASVGANGDSNRTMDVSGMNFGNIPNDAAATQQFVGTKDISQRGAGAYDGNEATKTIGDFGGNDNNKTQLPGDQEPSTEHVPDTGGRTMIFDDPTDIEDPQQATIRNRRKLVGWLVSYTLDEMGMDFKLYEGKNIIGRHEDCQIAIADKTVSAKHAIILFRAGRFSIADQQSTAGTFVNNEDIELQPRYLNDGDFIRVGKTILMFRSAF